MGSLLEGEMAEFLQGAEPGPPLRPAAGHTAGYTLDEAVREAGRCLHCDCHKKEACRLRELSDLLGAVQRRFHGPARSWFRRVQEHPVIIYEPGKCIRCGLCIQAAARAGEPLGLAFIGRGLEVRVGVPFGETLRAALENGGAECATVCPTGALAVRAPNPARRQP
jgi:predicted molibdopterin-dependent oxidoreductase YjgC